MAGAHGLTEGLGQSPHLREAREAGTERSLGPHGQALTVSGGRSRSTRGMIQGLAGPLGQVDARRRPSVGPRQT